MIYKLFGGPADGREVEIQDDHQMQTIRVPIENRHTVRWDCDYKGPAFEQAEYEKGEIGDAHFKRIIS